MTCYRDKFSYYDKDSYHVTSNTLKGLRQLFYTDDTKSAEVLEYVVKDEWVYKIGTLKRKGKFVLYKDVEGKKYEVRPDGSLGKKVR